MHRKKRIIYHDKGRDPHFKKWHTSDDIIILFVHSGSGFVVCSEKSYPFKSGTLCLIKYGKYHYTIPDDFDSYDRSKVYVSKEDFEKLVSVFPNSKISQLTDKSFVYAIPDMSTVREIEDIYNSICNNGDIYELYMSQIIKLLFLVNKFSTDDIPTSYSAVNKAIEYINQNIFKDITIDDISDALHISKYYFCRLFKSATGMTVMNYILNTRLTLAKEMILNDNMSITEVGILCNFSSTSYFCRVFKENTGLSPLKFKSQNKRN